MTFRFDPFFPTLFFLRPFSSQTNHDLPFAASDLPSKAADQMVRSGDPKYAVVDPKLLLGLALYNPSKKERHA